jgi:hypothetical protein
MITDTNALMDEEAPDKAAVSTELALERVRPKKSLKAPAFFTSNPDTETATETDTYRRFSWEPKKGQTPGRRAITTRQGSDATSGSRKKRPSIFWPVAFGTNLLFCWACLAPVLLGKCFHLYHHHHHHHRRRRRHHHTTYYHHDYTAYGIPTNKLQ